MSHLNKLRRLAAVGAGATAIVALAALPANAATITSVNPSPLVDGSPATVSGTGFSASTTYRVGICSVGGFGLLSIPACGDFTDSTTNGSGVLSATFTAEENGLNNHYNPMNPIFWGQPETVNCAEIECEIVITLHNGTSSTTVATTPAVF
jgi:hypothetical protein